MLCWPRQTSAGKSLWRLGDRNLQTTSWHTLKEQKDETPLSSSKSSSNMRSQEMHDACPPQKTSSFCIRPVISFHMTVHYAEAPLNHECITCHERQSLAADWLSRSQHACQSLMLVSWPSPPLLCQLRIIISVLPGPVGSSQHVLRCHTVK